MESKIKEKIRSHHGFLTERGKMLSWGRFHMLGLGLIFPVLILAELQAYGTAYFLLINISIIASAKLVDDIENKWMKKHKAHAHYLVLGNSITVIIMMLVNYLWI